MHRGYIKVWRKLEGSGLLQMPNTLALFMFLLMNAMYKDCKVGTTTGVVELKRGEYISGRKKLAADLNQSEREIRTSLSRLTELGIIDQQTTSRYSVYAIVKYNEYQDSDQQTTSTTTNKRPTNDQQTTTKEESKHLSIKELNTYICSPSAEILDYLNQKAQSNFRPVPANIKLIESRLKEGATVEEMKRVIDTMVAKWMDDEKMREYLRPSTLFNATKYSQYSGLAAPKQKIRMVSL